MELCDGVYLRRQRDFSIASSDDRDKQIEEPAHIPQFVEYKFHARHHCHMDPLVQAAPTASAATIGSATASLLRLLERYDDATKLQVSFHCLPNRYFPTRHWCHHCLPNHWSSARTLVGPL